MGGGREVISSQVPKWKHDVNSTSGVVATKPAPTKSQRRNMSESRSPSITAANPATAVSTGSDDAPNKLQPIHLTIPSRYYMLPGAAIIVGTTIGLFRGSRTASLRFLAENAHRPPTTVQGWYFYNKTKNYRVILGGLRGAGADALKLGTTAGGWVAIEEGCNRVGLDDFSEVAAGVGTAGVFSAVCESGPIFAFSFCSLCPPVRDNLREQC